MIGYTLPWLIHKKWLVNFTHLKTPHWEWLLNVTDGGWIVAVTGWIVAVTVVGATAKKDLRSQDILHDVFVFNGWNFRTFLVTGVLRQGNHLGSHFLSEKWHNEDCQSKTSCFPLEHPLLLYHHKSVHCFFLVNVDFASDTKGCGKLTLYIDFRFKFCLSVFKTATPLTGRRNELVIL